MPRPFKKKHILHIFTTFDVGGTETRTCHIINQLGDDFRHTLIIQNSDADKALQLIDPGIELTIKQLDKNPSGYVKKLRYYRKILKDIHADLLISYCWGTSDWVIANSINKLTPHIHNEEGFFDETPEHQFFRRWLIRRLFFKKASCLLVPSLFLKKLAMNSWKVPEKTIAFLPNGIDVDTYPVQTRKTHGPCILVIVAAIHPIKNHLRLLQAFTNIYSRLDIRLWIVGDGPDRPVVETFIADNNLSDHVKLLGFQNHPEIYLQKADIFCLTSDSEQMPMTVLEAMASGLPVMATDVGDVRHMVSDENKEFIVPCNDQAQFEQQLAKLILHPEIRIQTGRKNREKCKTWYNSHDMAKKHAALYIKTTSDG